MSQSPNMALAISQMNQENAKDPTLIRTEHGPRPRELVMAERLEVWVRKVAPNPSTALLLASRCQHLMRFAVPRTSYESGRIGYLKWRKDLAKLHAEKAGEILRAAGFDDVTIEAVRVINLKQNLRQNPDVQAMEDALCLSFLEHEFEEFLARHDDDKVIEIVRKSWAKMSARGHELALGLNFSERSRTLIERALA